MLGIHWGKMKMNACIQKNICISDLLAILLLKAQTTLKITQISIKHELEYIKKMEYYPAIKSTNFWYMEHHGWI